ncbi:MAG: Glycerophosphoryl diester phosphodiesterase [Thermoleophilia bacterium]|nr:Glycerophosphoryl diester phosphodiesterase [Thermoleophilia bacterium]
MASLAGATGLTRVVAHRGLHDDAGGDHQNSLRAFAAAIDAGADVIETDVRRTRDGVLVLHHDAELPDGRAIAQLDYDALPALPDGQRIPRLEELADLARTRGARLAVELKEPGYERDVAVQLGSRMPMAQVELISFSRDSVRAVETFDPSIRTGLLEPHLPVWMRNSFLYGLSLRVMDTFNWHPSLRAAAKVGADYVSVEQRMATPKFLAAAHAAHVPVDVWTVDADSDMQRLLATGLVQGLVTDRPQRALELRGHAAAGPALLAA